jgi:hypothetical protein
MKINEKFRLILFGYAETSSQAPAALKIFVGRNTIDKMPAVGNKAKRR